MTYRFLSFPAADLATFSYFSLSACVLALVSVVVVLLFAIVVSAAAAACTSLYLVFQIAARSTIRAY